jgi:4-amino-4-deoxy-L-arabinose transferase-like glycosyltransferase
MRIALLVGAITAALYLPRLSRAPIYLSPDEVFTGLQARSIAASGRDVGGRFLPFYIEYRYGVTDASGKDIVRSGWLPPMVYYTIAAALKVLPLSEAAIRLPTVLIGVLDVVLMFLVGRRLFQSDALGIVAAALLALTPAHFMFSRFALDYIYPLPFVLGWLLALLAYCDDGREKQLFVAALLLGLGIYSYIASALVMPLLFVLTLAALARERKPLREFGAAALGFFLPASLFIVWIAAHPQALADVLSKYDLLAPSGLNPLQSVRGFFTLHNIGDQISRWWMFFNPRFLFFEGPMEPMFSTRAIGVFALPLAVFLLLGLRASLRGRVGAAALVLVGGFLLSPLPATLVPVTDAIYRALELLPFVVLLSVAGVASLWTMRVAQPRRQTLILAGAVTVCVGTLYAVGMLVLRSRVPGAALPSIAVGGLLLVAGLVAPRFGIAQMIAMALLAIVPLQFAGFYVDYLTDYQNRVSLAFSGNIRGAFDRVIDEDMQASAPVVYLGSLGPRGENYWTFYLAEHHLEQLASRTDKGAFDADRILQLRRDSLIVTNAGNAQTDAAVDTLVSAGQLSRTVITEPNGTPTYLVLRRLGS